MSVHKEVVLSDGQRIKFFFWLIFTLQLLDTVSCISSFPLHSPHYADIINQPIPPYLLITQVLNICTLKPGLHSSIILGEKGCLEFCCENPGLFDSCIMQILHNCNIHKANLPLPRNMLQGLKVIKAQLSPLVFRQHEMIASGERNHI